jgi:P4 family phage/plasmid primase-like protien
MISKNEVFFELKLNPKLRKMSSEDFISAHECTNGEFTHVLNMENKDYYLKVNDNLEIKKFLMGKDIFITVTEIIPKTGSYIPNLKLKIPKTIETEDIRKIVFILQNVIKWQLKIPEESNSKLECFILGYQDEISIYFPKFRTSTHNLKEIEKLFNTHYHKKLKEFSEFESGNIHKTNLLLSNYKNYTFRYIYSYISDWNTGLNPFKTIEEWYLDVCKPDLVSESEKNENITQLLNQQISILNKTDLPEESGKVNSSLSSFQNMQESISEIQKKLPKNNEKNSTLTMEMLNDDKDPEEKLEHYFPLLMNTYSMNRIRNQNLWLDIGQALYTATEGKEQGLQLWQQCTQRLYTGSDEDKALYEKRKEEMVENWENFSVETNEDLNEHPSTILNYESLKFWSRLDNESKFNEIYEPLLDFLIMKSTNIYSSDAEIADVFCFLFGYKIKFTDEKGVWIFKDHRWNYRESKICVQQLILDQLSKHYRKVVNLLKAQIDELNKKFNKELNNELNNSLNNKASISNNSSNIEKKIDQLQGRLKKMSKIMIKFKETSKKRNIVSEICAKLFDVSFTEFCDENPFFICHKNGVYDLKRMYLREGRPNDCISLSTKINYRKPSDHSVVLLNKYMEQVFVDESLRHYMWIVASTLLEGKNFFKALYVLIGSGNNSKSVFVTLLEKAFGQYAVKLPITLITTKQKIVDGPSPSLAKARGARLAIFDELSQDTKLQDGTTKRLTGGSDTLQARHLFQSNIVFLPQFKIFLTSNNPINITIDQEALLNRINEIPFQSKFSDHPPQNHEVQVKEKHFLKDMSLESKLSKIVEAFIYVLTEVKYVEFKNTRQLPYCEIIEQRRKEFEKNSDPFQSFIDERIQPTIDPDEHGINVASTYYEFTNFYNKEHPNNKGSVPSKDSFIKILSEKLNKQPEFHFWKGYKLKESTSTSQMLHSYLSF